MAQSTIATFAPRKKLTYEELAYIISLLIGKPLTSLNLFCTVLHLKKVSETL